MVAMTRWSGRALTSVPTYQSTILCASRFTREDEAPGVLRKLNSHGIHAGSVFKRHIADFAGIPHTRECPYGVVGRDSIAIGKRGHRSGSGMTMAMMKKMKKKTAALLLLLLPLPLLLPVGSPVALPERRRSSSFPRASSHAASPACSAALAASCRRRWPYSRL